mmetsp:Transcript_12143/g.24760  ORF Transcript_12143/g.24760 Transcript_12143/m.24760 type:complete len:107 (-) Transcript_12143:1672-1992(-)
MTVVASHDGMTFLGDFCGDGWRKRWIKHVNNRRGRSMVRLTIAGGWRDQLDAMMTRLSEVWEHKLSDDQRAYVETLYIVLVVSSFLSIAAQFIRLAKILGIPPFDR